VKLNWLGRATMNNGVRRWGQYYAARWMERLGGRLEGGRVLEVGCGRGVGAQIILERFGAASIEAIDLDPKMIECARRFLGESVMARVRLNLGNVTHIQASDASFDAVFDFGAIHLEPDWPVALAEVRRVLKPGGKFFFEWVTDRFLRLTYPFVTKGFRQMEAPNPTQLIQELKRQGINVGQSFVRPRIAALTGVVGDLIGVGLAEFTTSNRGPGHALASDVQARTHTCKVQITALSAHNIMHQHCQWKIAGGSLAKISRAVLSRFSSRQRSLEPRPHPGSDGVFAPAGR